MILCCPRSRAAPEVGTGLPKWTVVFARNLAEIIEDIWKLLVFFFPSISCICEGEEEGVFPEKWGC